METIKNNDNSFSQAKSPSSSMMDGWDKRMQRFNYNSEKYFAYRSQMINVEMTDMELNNLERIIELQKPFGTWDRYK